MLPWAQIDTVIFDMDGTLLDLYFDNRLWLHEIPQAIANQQQRPIAEVKAELAQKYQQIQGTLNWYCYDYWCAELSVAVDDIQHHCKQHIQWLPNAPQLLESLKQAGKRLVLLTNAHPRSLAFKHQHCGINDYFDLCLSTHQFGRPKEDPQLWQQLFAQYDIEPSRSAFVDDNVRILQQAQTQGIRYVVQVCHPDSSQPAIEVQQDIAVNYVGELLKSLRL